MPKVSTKAVMKILTNASSSRGSYVPQKLKTFISKTRISHPVFGSQRLSNTLKKPDIEQKKLAEIFKKAKEEGVLRQTASTKSEKDFYRAAAKEERVESQIEKKESIKSEQKNPNIDSKEAKIVQARQDSARLERRSRATFGGPKEGGAEKQEAIRKEDRVHEAGAAFRKGTQVGAGVQKEQEKKYGIKFRGRMGEKNAGSAENKVSQLLSKVMREEKSGGNTPVSQKSGGHQGLELKSMAGINELTHPETPGRDFTGGVIHVKGLDQAPAPRPESLSDQKSSSAPEDITDIDIG